MCYNIRNYANIDVSRPLIDMQGSTKIASSDHQRKQGANFVNFPNPYPNPYRNPNWQSNSEVCTVGIGRTCYVPQVCLCHRRFFPLLRFVRHLHFEVAISILWRLAICIHVVDIRARFVPTFIRLFRMTWFPTNDLHALPPSIQESPSSTWNIILHVSEVTQQGLASLKNWPCLLCVL